MSLRRDWRKIARSFHEGRVVPWSHRWACSNPLQRMGPLGRLSRIGANATAVRAGDDSSPRLPLNVLKGVGGNLKWQEYTLMRTGLVIMVVSVMKAATGLEQPRAGGGAVNDKEDPNYRRFLHAFNRKISPQAPMRAPHDSLVELFIRLLES
ncbi:MAG: hypothetical protein FJ118_17305 [Deltaproteobacteria bacterium]|nr:hypothetical protein [Deltaproteobacteria bacterium]